MSWGRKRLRFGSDLGIAKFECKGKGEIAKKILDYYSWLLLSFSLSREITNINRQ
jgi:hypothetical protein